MRETAQPRASSSRARRITPAEYGLRFLFGGIVTALVGLVDVLYGPVVAGLFLALPAILPASLTLVEGHDGRQAAAADALGAAVGSIGLLAFGAVIWLLAARTAGALTLAMAAVVWFAVGVALWWVVQEEREAASGE